MLNFVVTKNEIGFTIKCLDESSLIDVCESKEEYTIANVHSMINLFFSLSGYESDGYIIKYINAPEYKIWPTNRCEYKLMGSITGRTEVRKETNIFDKIADFAIKEAQRNFELFGSEDLTVDNKDLAQMFNTEVSEFVDDQVIKSLKRRKEVESATSDTDGYQVVLKLKQGW